MLMKVRAWMESNRLIRRNDRIIAACSGGPDSMALVHILSRLAPEWGLTLAVAHLNHMFRGAESQADAVHVGRFCAGLGLDFYHTAIDVPAYIAGSGRSTQDAARVLRYRYLRRVAAALAGAKIAIGHHRDDQAETVLLNLLRGAGSAGLGGMKPIEGDVIRPLLDVSRKEIEAYCAEYGLKPRQDSSNLKLDYLRNYLRLELMPLLQERFNANLSETLCRTARLVGDEHRYIAEQVSCLSSDIIKAEKESLVIDCCLLNDFPVALRREIFRQTIEKKQGSLKGITFLHVERLVELAANGMVGSIVELPGGLIARRGYDSIRLGMPTVLRSPPGIGPPGIELDIPGTTVVPALNVAITAGFLQERPPNNRPGSVVFDWDQLSPPLIIRTRQEGDRFRPAGAPGGKKLKDFLIDGKVPREMRDAIPLVCDQQEIVWVGGYRQAQRALPDNTTKCFLQLTLQQED